jgi:hypothetical protein
MNQNLDEIVESGASIGGVPLAVLPFGGLSGELWAIAASVDGCTSREGSQIRNVLP